MESRDTAKFLPKNYLVAPNRTDASVLFGIEAVDDFSMENDAAATTCMGVNNFLVKGGHLDDGPVDLLWFGNRDHRFPASRNTAKNTHRIGRVFAAAITECLANGEDFLVAVEVARWFICETIRISAALAKGCGLVNFPSRPPSTKWGAHRKRVFTFGAE